MKSAFKILGSVGGYAGVLVCLVAIAGRFYGAPRVFGWAAGNMLLLGVAILAAACWSKLEAA
jgi:hypothetical protein